jgi:hypothetical protein
MEMDLVQRRRISSRILKETQTAIPPNSTKTLLISQVSQPTLDMIPPQLMNTSEDLKLLETENFVNFKS